MDGRASDTRCKASAKEDATLPKCRTHVQADVVHGPRVQTYTRRKHGAGLHSNRILETHMPISNVPNRSSPSNNSKVQGGRTPFTSKSKGMNSNVRILVARAPDGTIGGLRSMSPNAHHTRCLHARLRFLVNRTCHQFQWFHMDCDRPFLSEGDFPFA